MLVECGPWRSCDFHQYRSWLRRAESATIVPAAPEKETRPKPRRGRRRPMPGDYQLVFRHHDDPAQYERDYLAQVTHARCRVANPHATLLAPTPEESRPPPPQQEPAAATEDSSVSMTAAEPSTSNVLQTTESTPDLSAGSRTPPPVSLPASTPDLCQLPRIDTAAPSRVPAHRRTAPSQSGGAARRRTPLNPSTLRVYDKPARTEQLRQPASGSASTLRPRRQQARQPSTPSMVTLDLPSPQGFGSTTPPKRNWHNKQPRGLTKIQFATPVPENLTIIVGRKLEISLSGSKQGQRGRGFH